MFLFKNRLLPILFIMLGAAMAMQGCFPVKSFFLTAPGPKDSKRFAHQTAQPGLNIFHFHQTATDYGKLIKVDDWTSDKPVFRNVVDIVADHNVSAFLIVHNDTLLVEHYHPRRSPESRHTSYSLAKSFTSALLGIAIQEGHIASIDELAADYLPELNYHPYFRQLTIRHLLNHTSGIQYSLALDGTIYYGKNLQKGLKRIKFDMPPGTVQQYLNINTQLLGIIIERATKIPISQYLETKIWQPLGMEADAQWNTDGKGQVKTYCCLNARARDYARFGRLYLNGGSWQGQQLINEEWIGQSISRDTTQGSSFGYNHSWHIGLKNYNDFMAIGFYKQHLYINPDKNLIIVLLAHKEGKLKAERANWWHFFRQIADQF